MPRRGGIAFLCCVDDEAKATRLAESIEAIERPAGIDVRVLRARGAPSMAAGYNGLRAEAAGAQIKVYLHQDVVVLSRSLVADLLRLFRRRTLGLVGVAGVKYLPPSAIWWDGSGLYGKVVEDRGDGPRLLAFDEPQGDVEPVECVDGLFMATRHDLPWDEAIPGFDFYDVAQSTRYVLAGWEVAVARQPEPWLRHETGAADRAHSPEFLAARDVYLERYGRARERLARSPVRRRLLRLRARARA